MQIMGKVIGASLKSGIKRLCIIIMESKGSQLLTKSLSTLYVYEHLQLCVSPIYSLIIENQ